MQRDFFNDFYFAVRDDSSSGDTLNQLKVWAESDEIKFKTESIYAPYMGDIVALEMDPLGSNDFSTNSQQKGNELRITTSTWINKMFIMDRKLNLYKMQIDKECTIEA